MPLLGVHLSQLPADRDQTEQVVKASCLLPDSTSASPHPPASVAPPPPPLSSSPSAHLSFPSLTPSTRCHIPRSRTLLSLRTADVHGAAALCVPPSVTCCLSRLTNPACLLLLYPTRQHRLRFSSGSHLISTGRVDVELPTLTSFTIRLLSQRTFEFIYLEPLQYSTRVTRYRSTSPDRYLSFTMPGKTGMPSPLLRARSKCSGLTCFQRL